MFKTRENSGSDSLTRSRSRKSRRRQRELGREQQRRYLLEQLEERCLLTGVPGLIDVLQAERVDSPQTYTATVAAPNWTEWSVALPAQQARRELVIVDAATPDYQQLLDDLTSGAIAGRQFEALVIDSSIDGINALTEILENRSDLDALHIISHGSPGSVQLGNTVLNASNVAEYSDAIQGWGDALREGADLLFYGCDLAGNAAGEQFVDQLADLTGTDVAASRDVTGSAAQGGNWTFEYVSGSIETEVAISPLAQAGWGGTLAFDVPVIGNRVWLDENGDGVQDAGEDGIANVTVTLTPPALIDAGGGIGLPITTITGADGSYIFTDLPAGEVYTIAVTQPGASLVTDMVQTSDPDGTLDNSTTVTPAVGEERFDVDFGYNWSNDPSP